MPIRFLRIAALMLLLGGVVALAAPGTVAADQVTPPTPTQPASPSPQADAALGEAEQLYGQNDFDGALGKLNLALGLYQQVHDGQGQGMALYSMGLCYNGRGETTRAMNSFQQALAFMRDAHNAAAEAQILDQIAHLYQRQTVTDAALQSYGQEQAIWHTLGNAEAEARILWNIGTVHADAGQYPAALEALNAAQALQQQLPDRAAQAQTMVSLGTVYDRQGEYAQALRALTQALQIQQQLDGTDQASTLNALGLVYLHLGQNADSMGYFQQAGDHSADVLAKVVILNNMAAAYARSDGAQPDKELLYYQAAYGAADQSHQWQYLASIGTNIGLVYDELGRYGDALVSLQGAYKTASDLNNRADAASALHTIGVTYARQNQLDRALDNFNQALTLRQSIGDRAGEAATRTAIGAVDEAQGQTQGALAEYDAAIKLYEQIRSSANLEELKTSIAEQSITTYQRAVLLRLRSGQPDVAFDLAERARARTFLDQVGNSRIDVHKGANPTLIQREQQLRQELAALEHHVSTGDANLTADGAGVDQSQTFAGRLGAKQHEYEQLLTEIKLTNPDYHSLVSVDPLKLADIQKLLDDRTTLLSLFVTPDETVAFVVTRASLRTVELTFKAPALDTALQQFRDSPDRQTAVPDSLKQLYAMLIAPLAQDLRTPVLGIVPSQELYYVPFAALGDGQHALGADYTLFELPSASALPFIQQQRKVNDSSAFVIAQRRPDVANLPQLQYANEEAQKIAALYGTQPLLDDAATKSALLAHAGAARIVHVVAHGQLNRTNPLFSRILLRGDGSTDGSLTVQEVYGLDLKNVDLTVLSACQTQLGAQSRGDDVVGLNRAFIYAGAPTVIASLWNVDDEATALLMTSFYKHLKGGMGKADALRAAQADVRANPAYVNPYYWAAFVLTGDPGHTTTSLRSWLIPLLGAGSGALLLVAGIWFVRRRKARAHIPTTG